MALVSDAYQCGAKCKVVLAGVTRSASRGRISVKSGLVAAWPDYEIATARKAEKKFTAIHRLIDFLTNNAL